MMNWTRWLGLDEHIRQTIEPSLASLEHRLARLAESQEALRQDVEELKSLIDAIIRRNSRD
jgi:prefoldin subunit 5